MEYNDDVVVPGADAPAYATSSDRFRTTAEEAAAAGYVAAWRRGYRGTTPTPPLT